MSPTLNWPEALALIEFIARTARSEGGRLGVGGEERRRVSREGLRILKQRAVPRVGVRQQDGVRQVLAQSVGVGNRNHLVVDTVHDERGMPDGPQFSESLAVKLLPLAECRH